MERELKRVPLDFAWPIGMVWKGYVNPYHAQFCTPCDGSGYNAATKQTADDFYDLGGTRAGAGVGQRSERRWCDRITQDEVDALVKAGRLRKWEGGEWVTVPRTAAEVNAANGKHCSGMGDMSHDGLNRWILIETRAKRLGVWGKCPTCKGKGEVWFSKEIQRKSGQWRRRNPPKGPGYQLWETTSEGSPKSPVFASLDELCAWCADNTTTFGSARATAKEWREMLDAGFVHHSVGNATFI